MDRPDEELDTYDEIDRRFGSSENAFFLVAVAIALETKARALFRLQRWAESIAVCEAIQSRFGEHESGEFLGVDRQGADRQELGTLSDASH